MQTIFITAVIGNVGLAIIKYLNYSIYQLKILAGINEITKNKNKFFNHNVNFIKFDFMNTRTCKPALKTCNILFLLLTPQIFSVNKYFKTLVKMALAVNIKHIIFLSIQGIKKSTVIPYHKIEKLMVENKIPYTFLRTANFIRKKNQAL